MIDDNTNQNKYNQINLTLKLKNVEQNMEQVINHIIMYLCLNFNLYTYFVIDCKFIRISSIIYPNEWFANTFTDLSMPFKNILSYYELFK